MMNKSVLLVVAFLGFLNVATASPIRPPWRPHVKTPLGSMVNRAVIPPQEIDDCLVNLVAALNNEAHSSPSIDITATDAEFFDAHMSAEPVFFEHHLYIIRAGFGDVTCAKQQGSCKRAQWRKTAHEMRTVFQGGCYGERCCGGVKGSCFDRVEVDPDLELIDEATPGPDASDSDKFEGFDHEPNWFVKWLREMRGTQHDDE
ncbi:hypothetical protein D6D17_09404 [Aureobasidium pullulans]|nr:hypothetical protein D6D17_09404 [Aureobasidium pullulans]